MESMTHLLWQIFVLASSLVGLLVAYSLLVRLIRTVVSFIGELVDTAVAVFFLSVIVPLVWLWEKGRRPMWHTLTPQQSQELREWLHRP
jgi:hypothetical protein